jgi:hypothetical protein
VQFEAAASVDAALAISGEVGANGRFVKVESSRFPDIAVVINTGQPAEPKPDKPKEAEAGKRLSLGIWPRGRATAGRTPLPFEGFVASHAAQTRSSIITLPSTPIFALP